MTTDKNDIRDIGDKPINILLEIDYNTYKNKIKTNIFKHYTKIYEIFSEEFNDNLIKMYILLKKELLEKKLYIKYIKTILELCKQLDIINYIDQQEYFITIIKLFNIFLLIKEINKEHEKEETYLKFIDINYMNNKIVECIIFISKDNIIGEIFLLFINKKNKYTQRYIIALSEKLSVDFFMYWSSQDLYELIINNINITKNRLLISIKKYKYEFINLYEKKTNILKKLYSDQTYSKLILKYKLDNKNTLFNELIKDIEAINKKFNTLK
jgi:hypothetical protein